MRPAAATRVFSRLAVRDRVLFRRIATGPPHHSIARWGWTFLTHGGGVVASIVAATLPMLLGGALRHAAMRALLTLVVSHVVVQAIKRTVGRPRPRLRNAASKTWASEPDRFSFPSGHSAAVISVALAYAVAFPQFALVLLPIALFVGFSRVRLGVHYPGDVLAGQIIAVATALVVLR
jgi:undecaprenyl-diphosphatase